MAALSSFLYSSFLLLGAYVDLFFQLRDGFVRIFDLLREVFLHGRERKEDQRETKGIEPTSSPSVPAPFLEEKQKEEEEEDAEEVESRRKRKTKTPRGKRV